MPTGSKVASSALNAIILGAPGYIVYINIDSNIVTKSILGSGKGTISKKLISGFNFHHLSTGDLLRDAIA